jgi:pimeloyl-ACP methyl ester carboxylesterase
MPFAGTPEARISFEVVEPLQPVGDADALLLIMGFLGSGAMWWRLLPHVSRRHRVLVFDNRGTGGSSPARGPLTMAGLAGDAVAVLDAAGVQRAHVMGASMGGMIAQHLALDHRARVRSLVLACTTAGGRREAPNPRMLAAGLLRPLLGARRTFTLVAPTLYAPVTLAGARERLRQDMSRRAADRVGSLTAVAQMAAIAGHDTRARLHELAGVPTLVIHGADDRLVAPRHGHDLARRIPGARLLEIPGAGHLLTTDAEDEVAAAVLDHLERHASAAPADLPARVP